MNHHPLSIEQKRILGIEATKAYAAEAEAGRLNLPAEVASCTLTERREFWRHSVVSAATQRVVRFSDMWQDEYLPVLREFQRLSGNIGKAYKTSVRNEIGAACHRAPGCEWVRDMHHWMTQAGFKDGYVAVIMFAKFKTRELTALNEGQLKQLHDTVVNRCRAKLGKGSAADRNKKQRAGGGSKFPAPGSPLEHPVAKPGRDYVLKPAAKFTPPSEGDPF